MVERDKKKYNFAPSKNTDYYPQVRKEKLIENQRRMGEDASHKNKKEWTH